MSIYTNWDPLEEVIVGNCNTEIPLGWNIESEARPLINRILQETKEDLDNLAKILQGLGVKVHRPIPHLFPEKIVGSQKIEKTLGALCLTSFSQLPKIQFLFAKTPMSSIFGWREFFTLKSYTIVEWARINIPP